MLVSHGSSPVEVQGKLSEVAHNAPGDLMKARFPVLTLTLLPTSDRLGRNTHVCSYSSVGCKYHNGARSQGHGRKS